MMVEDGTSRQLRVVLPSAETFFEESHEGVLRLVSYVCKSHLELQISHRVEEEATLQVKFRRKTASLRRVRELFWGGSTF